MKTDMDIKIESNVPIPPLGSSLTEAVRSMKVGDSFLWPTKNRTSIPITFHKLNWKYVSRKVSDTEVRVWRTE